LDKSLFKAFNAGDVNKVGSVPDHQPSSKEDTIEGRYTTVLFTSASQANQLYEVYEDMVFLAQLYHNSESF